LDTIPSSGLEKGLPLRSALDEPDLERVQQISRWYPTTKAYLALLGDKQFLFNDARTAFIMYAAYGQSWIAMGDPIGPPDAALPLVRRFQELALDHGTRPVFHEVRPECLPLYHALGMRSIRVAEEGRISLKAFSIEGREKGKLRNAVRKAQSEGCEFAMIPPAAIQDVLPELKSVSDAWLATKRTREKRFSMGRFEEDYVSQFGAGVVRRAQRIIAFVTVWSGDPTAELFVDLIRWRQDVPRGTVDFLFVRLIDWARAEGYAWLTLGMTPLPEPAAEDHRGFLAWLMWGMRRLGDRFYNVQGLRDYKDKFEPAWAPRYAVAPGKVALVHGLMDLVVVTSGGWWGVVAK